MFVYYNITNSSRYNKKYILTRSVLLELLKHTQCRHSKNKSRRLFQQKNITVYFKNVISSLVKIMNHQSEHTFVDTGDLGNVYVDYPSTATTLNMLNNLFL